jgi:hypothetical protein
MAQDMSSLYPNSKRLHSHEFEAFAVLCQDPRFTSSDDGDRKAVRKALGADRIEFIQIAGGAGSIASIDSTLKSKEALQTAIGVAVRNHAIRKGILINHGGVCGAYKLAGKTFETKEAEKEFHTNELLAAHKQVLEWFPEIEELRIGFMIVDENDEVVVELID